jgi:predicted phosphohydrolase
MQLNEEEKEKELDQTPTKPVSSRRLKICHISDPHGKHKQLTIPECDVLICSGDISMLGQKHEVQSFFAWFNRQIQATYKILVAGNHDISFDPEKNPDGLKPAWLNQALFEFKQGPNNFYLENQSCEIWGVKFWGSPTSAWFHGERWAFNVREPEAEALYSTIPLGTDVVITHGPSWSNGDWCINCACYVGDRTLTKELYRVQPLIHLFGHIHESYGHTRVKNTHFFNGSSVQLDYETINEPWLLDVDFDEKEVNILNKT